MKALYRIILYSYLFWPTPLFKRITGVYQKSKTSIIFVCYILYNLCTPCILSSSSAYLASLWYKVVKNVYFYALYETSVGGTSKLYLQENNIEVKFWFKGRPTLSFLGKKIHFCAIGEMKIVSAAWQGLEPAICWVRVWHSTAELFDQLILEHWI